jgi:hypothetical protein
MLAVRLTKILMKHNPVNYRQTAVNAIDQKKCQPCDITRLDNQFANGKQYDKGNPH